MRILFRRLSWGAVGLLVCAMVLPGCRTKVPEKPADVISAAALMQHIKVLSSDEFEGRAPATRGEERTVNYLTEQFRRVGAKPGNPDGTFVQRVPLVGVTASDVKVSFASNERAMPLGFPTNVVVWTKRFTNEIVVDNSEMIFVGYGVVAPEYGWDDFKGLDVRGKTIVVLINDPAVPDPSDPAKLDDRMFKGKAMTYYGRWTYKFEVAAEKGAAACIVIHETGPAGYPWAVVEGSNSRENFDLRTPDKNMNRIPVEGWITSDKAKELFAASGKDFDAMKRAAVTREFKPVPLNATASFRFKNTLREVQSRNVIAKVEGTDPNVRDEYVIYTAHWDHLGRDTTLSGDQIFNGAADNGSGTAALLEISRAFARNPARRSALFLAVTAEEKGLLGAKHYAASPLYPLARALANINMDNMNPWGRTRDITVIGLGQTTLEATLGEVAAERGRTLTPDAEPEKGRYFRSDHFEFAKRGVPGLYTHSGIHFIGKPESYGLQKSEEYTTRDYHKVSDEIKPGWDLSGMADDATLLFQVGQGIANETRWPEWKPESEFRKLREPRR
jgi:Zn-dependent M28 family amino/carboxypeptidase